MNVKVLIVEDDPTNLKNGIEALEKLGFTVYSATNVQDGLDLLEKENFYLAFSDMQMPIDRDGNIVERAGMKIVSAANAKKIPVIVVTKFFHPGAQIRTEVYFDGEDPSMLSREGLNYRQSFHSEIKTKEIWKSGFDHYKDAIGFFDTNDLRDAVARYNRFIPGANLNIEDILRKASAHDFNFFDN